LQTHADYQDNAKKAPNVQVLYDFTLIFQQAAGFAAKVVTHSKHDYKSEKFVEEKHFGSIKWTYYAIVDKSIYRTYYAEQ
jgi:hypothetical protein